MVFICRLSIDYAGMDRKRWATTLACTCICHIKNAHVVCCLPETFYGVFPHLFLVHSLSTLFIKIFTITLSKFSLCLYSTFYLLFFSHKVTFVFSCICYLLNILKHSSNHSVCKALNICFYLLLYFMANFSIFNY